MRSLWLFAALLLLCACSSAPVDPYALQSQGERMVSAARSLQTATADAYVARMLDADATRQAHDYHMQTTADALNARATAVSIEQTAAAGHISATATAGAVAQSAYMAQVTATHVSAVAAQEAATRAEFRQWRAIGQSIAGVLLFVVGLALAVAMARVLWLAPEWIIEWADRRRRVLDTASGLILLTETPNGYNWMLASDAYHMRPRPGLLNVPQVERAPAITGEIVDAPQIDSDEMLAGRLILDAINVNGKDANMIPSWRVLQEDGQSWTSRPWQDAVRWLKQHGAINTVERGGTYLSSRYATLYSLNVDMVTGKLSPTRHAPPSRAVRHSRAQAPQAEDTDTEEI